MIFWRAPESMSTIRLSPRNTPCSIWAFTCCSENGPKSRRSFCTSQRASSWLRPAAADTSNGRPAVAAAAVPAWGALAPLAARCSAPAAGRAAGGALATAASSAFINSDGAG